VKARTIETTSLGAALAAGRSIGLWNEKDNSEAAADSIELKKFQPTTTEEGNFLIICFYL
jgi:glycerol kinase